MIIYFRACEKQETISYVNRYKSYSKTEILKKCWISLQESVRPTDNIILLNDNLSSETLTYLMNTCATTKLEIVQVKQHEWKIHQHTIDLIDTLEQKIKDYPEELHYIVEDDYLHLPNSIIILEETLKNWPFFAVSYDYPDRYSEEEIKKGCNLMLGLDRHWRTISSCTMTALAKGKTWQKYMPELKQAAPTSNDKVFEFIFSKEICISPIPALSSHMTANHLSPLVDWESLWNDIKL